MAKKPAKDEAWIPVGFCPSCKEEMPIQIETMVHKKKKVEVDIAHCPKCEFVLNLGEDFKIRWVTEKEIIKMGWKPD